MRRSISAVSSFGLAPPRARQLFVAIVSYYVLAMYLIPSSAIVSRFSLSYFALVLPAWLYVALNWRSLVRGYSTPSRCLAVFAVLASAYGGVQGDWPLAYNSIFLATVAIVILNTKSHLTINELNWLFLCAIGGSVVIHTLGITDYGYLLGQARANGCHAAMNWRVSLFRVTAESAMFSLVVLAANLLWGRALNGWIRALVIFCAAYFLVFSGVRAIVFASALVLPACIYVALRQDRPHLHRNLLLGVLATLLIALLPLSLGDDLPGFWENYALRTKSCEFLDRYSADHSHVMDEGGKPASPARALPAPPEVVANIPPDWYGRTINRHCASMYQIALFARSPFGSRDIYPHSEEDLVNVGCADGQLYYYCTGCNFATHWLARAGVWAIPLLLCFLTLLWSGLKSRNIKLVLLLTAFGLSSIGWGVMFTPYNFVLFILLSTPALTAAYNRPTGDCQ